MGILLCGLRASHLLASKRETRAQAPTSIARLQRNGGWLMSEIRLSPNCVFDSKVLRASCQRENLLTRPNRNDDKVLGIGEPTIGDFWVFFCKRKTCVNCLCSLQAVR